MQRLGLPDASKALKIFWSVPYEKRNGSYRLLKALLAVCCRLFVCFALRADVGVRMCATMMRVVDCD